MKTRWALTAAVGAALWMVAGSPAAWGTTAPAFHHVGSVRQRLEAPTAVAVDAGENLYVAESSRDRVQVYGPDGTLVRSVRDLHKPISVAVGPDGRVYVGSAETGSVGVYDASFGRVGQLGGGAGEVGQPTGIGVGERGEIYVADGTQNRIRVYNADLTPKATFGTAGSGNGQFRRPVSLAVDRAAGEVYVVDLPVIETEVGTASGARVQVFDLEGGYRRSFGTFGRGDGYLTRPAGVAVDGRGRVYVADAFQNLVQMFTTEGVFLGSVFDLENPLRVPMGVTYSRRTARLYAASLNLARVEVYGLEVATPSVSVRVEGSGSVEPAGPVVVEEGGSVAFEATAAAGYHLGSVQLGGADLPVAGGRFTVSGVAGEATVVVVFEKDPEAVTWTVTASAGAHGAIEPRGAVVVAQGGDQVFTLTPETGYHVAEIWLDGTMELPQGATSYTVRDVRAAHLLEARFAADTRPGEGEGDTKKTWTVTASAGANGEIRPSGAIAVSEGSGVRFTVVAHAGYVVADVRVDGASKGPVTAYTLGAVGGDHSIQASFAAKPPTATTDPTGRYVDNGDGTLTDREAGLMWLADADCAQSAGYDPGAQGAGVLTWEQALGFVRRVDDGAVGGCAAGRDDWRLPNARELETLTRGGARACGDAPCATHAAWLASLGFQNLAADPYWASTSSADAPQKAWAATLTDATMRPVGKTQGGAALLVRDGPEGSKTPKTGQSQCYGEDGEGVQCNGTGQDGEHKAGAPWPSPRFIDNGEGTVTDELTGLEWLKDAGCVGPRAAETLGGVLASFNADPGSFACAGYAGGRSDWRLPGGEELRSLVDYAVRTPALPAGAPFFRVGAGAYWAASEGAVQAAELGSADSAARAALTGDPQVWLVRTQAAPRADGSDAGGAGGGGCFVSTARANRAPKGSSLWCLAALGGLGLLRWRRPRLACRTAEATRKISAWDGHHD